MGYKYQPNTDRDKIVKKLGYGHYNQYLKSDLWREVIKPKVLAEHDRKCFVCGSKKNLEIHHMDYNTQNLSGKNTNNMILRMAKRWDWNKQIVDLQIWF